MPRLALSLVFAIRLMFAGLGILALASTFASAAEGEPFEIKLQSGRIVRGEIDARSDQSTLRLRSGTAAMRIVRPIAWEVVVSARRGDEHWTAKELRRNLAQFTTPAPRFEPRLTPSASDAPRKEVQPAIDPIAADIGLYVRAANWDTDLETDGLLVEVTLNNRDGQRIAADVTFEGTLIAARRVDFNARPASQGLTFEPIGQWSLLVRATDFVDGVARVQLPYQAIRPDRDMSVATHGLLQMKIGVPGSGVWERSYDSIRLRPYAPTRDAQERINGQRLFGSETYGP